MSRFSNEPSIRALLYEQFNARICLVDIYYIYKLFEARQYHNQEATLFLLYQKTQMKLEHFWKSMNMMGLYLI